LHETCANDSHNGRVETAVVIGNFPTSPHRLSPYTETLVR